MKKLKKIEIIFHLIQEMSRTDKRTFKLYHQIYKGQDKAFLKLFDFLNTIDSFDRTKVKHFFIREQIDNKNLQISYLYERLISSLSQNACESFHKFHGYSLLHSLSTFAVFLYVGLYDLAYEELCRVEQKALEESYGAEVLYIQKFKTVIVQQQEIQEAVSFNDILDTQINITEQLLTEFKLFKINSILRRHDKNDENYKSGFQALSEYEKKLDKLSSLAKIHFYGAKYHHYYLHNEFEQSVLFIEKVIDLWERYNDKQRDNNAYLLAWNNIFSCCLRGKLEQQGSRYYERYCQLPQNFPQLFKNLPMRLWSPYRFTGHYYNASHAIRYRAYKHIEQIEKPFEADLIRFAEHLTFPTIINGTLIHMTYGNLILKKYARVAFWLDKLQDRPDKKSRQLAESQMLELMVLYDEQSYELLKSRIISFKRKWAVEKPGAGNALFTLDFIRRLMLKTTQKRLPDFLKNTHQEALEYEAENPTTILVSRWIEQKIVEK